MTYGRDANLVARRAPEGAGLKNVTVYIGHIDRDLGALRRNPKLHLANTLDLKLKELASTPDGLVFCHMETDEKRYRVVCVNRVPLDWPVDLDDVTGRHTGFHASGAKKGKPKGVGPRPTELAEEPARNLLADVVAKNTKLADVIAGTRGTRTHELALSNPGAPVVVANASELSGIDSSRPLTQFDAAIAGMPRTTEAERTVVERVGQGIFRAGLMKYWGGRCAVTGLAVPELLRASHIRRWAECANDRERLDVYHGLLLAAHLDAAFDAGLVTISSGGDVLVSSRLEPDARELLGLNRTASVRRLQPQHEPYLVWHRGKVFLG
jgi:putative restriction endonuclease